MTKSKAKEFRQQVKNINPDHHYNILSIDGFGAKAYVPAYIVNQMETEAFQIAEVWEKAIDRYPKKRVEMHNIVNMVAGSSSGSIVAAGLSYAAKTQEGGANTNHQENPTSLIMNIFT